MRNRLVQSSEIRLQMDFLETRTIWLARNTDNSKSSSAATAANTAAGAAASTAGGLSGGDNQPNIRNAISSHTTLGPYGQAIETLELRRTSLFAVITQFNALFRQSDAHQDSTNSSSR